MKNRWIALYVENEVGVLAKVSGLFSGKSYNLQSLTVGTTEDITVSRMTICVTSDDITFEQIKKQLNRMVEVIKVIDLTDMAEVDMTDKATAGKVANRITAAAKDNKNFTVTANSATNTKGTGYLFLTEKEGGVDYSKNNLAGEDGKGSGYDGTPGTTEAPDSDVAVDWKGLVQFGTATVKGTGLTLQIGDTSDSYNQLNVNIGDIHTKALGISNIDISTQVGAANAVNTVKNAINSVSSIRGTLGATQNRLEHTQNNLSVMKENIQDAESTIRDTDVAEEMMAYTKNNILVQSAQAMLAQANQIPQGVLQLLG